MIRSRVTGGRSGGHLLRVSLSSRARLSGPSHARQGAGPEAAGRHQINKCPAGTRSANGRPPPVKLNCLSPSRGPKQQVGPRWACCCCATTCEDGQRAAAGELFAGRTRPKGLTRRSLSRGLRVAWLAPVDASRLCLRSRELAAGRGTQTGGRPGRRLARCQLNRSPLRSAARATPIAIKVAPS